MTNSAEHRAENVYIDIYGVVVENSDYFEPEVGVDLILAEAFIGTLAATVVTAFMNGLLEEFGKGLGEKLRTRPFRRAELVETDAKVLIAELARRFATGELDAGHLAEGQAELERTLLALGIAEGHSVRITNQVLEVVERHRYGK
jgi:hypothetical protein